MRIKCGRRQKWSSVAVRFLIFMGTLLASSGSTLGHGPTTRTHAFRRPPKAGEVARGTRTHTQYYVVRRVYSAGAQWLRPPRRSLSGWLRRHPIRTLPTPHQNPPHTPSHPCSLSPNQLPQAARAWRRPQYAPRSGAGNAGAAARAWLDHADRRSVVGFPLPPQCACP